MVALLALAIVLIIVFLLMPTPKTGMDGNALNNFDYPTASNGRVIPELFGTARLSGNVIWYGDLRSEEIMYEG